MAKKTRYNNRKIIINEQTLPIGKLLPGMIVTFSYSKKGIYDRRPLVFFMYNSDEYLIMHSGHHDANPNTLNPNIPSKFRSILRKSQ